MILLHISNLLASISYLKLYENIQDTIIKKYNKNEFEVIDLRKKNLLINIEFVAPLLIWRERFINEEEYSITKNEEFKFYLDSKNNVIIKYDDNNEFFLKEFLIQTFKDRVIDYKIFYNLSACSISKVQKKIIDIFMENLKEYHKNHRIRIIRNGDLLFYSIINNLKSSEIICRDDAIIINFIFKRKNCLYFFNINYEEINFKSYFIDFLKDYKFLKLSDEHLLRRLFNNFKFSYYSFMYNSIEIQEDFINNTSMKESKYIKNPYIFDMNYTYIFYENFLIIDNKIYSSCSFINPNISVEMFDEMKDFFSFSLNLKNDDLLSVGLLYYSMTDDMKLLVVNKIMESYYSSYSIIFFHIIRNLNLITKDEFENIINLNFALRSLNEDKMKSDVLQITYKNLYDKIIKYRILEFRPNPQFSYSNYLMILFAKVLNEVYLSDDYKSDNFYWKKLYDEILDKLHLPKDDSSAFNIFKHVLKDLENVTYILQYEQTAILDILSHLNKLPPLIYSNYNFYYKSKENKNLEQNGHLENLPIKDELINIMN